MAYVSMHRAVLPLGLAGQTEARLDLFEFPGQQFTGIPPDLRPMLEAMPGPGTDQQHIARRRVAVDQQITIRTVLVLTDALLIQWRASECGKTPGHVRPRIRQRTGRGQPIAAIRIDR